MKRSLLLLVCCVGLFMGCSKGADVTATDGVAKGILTKIEKAKNPSGCSGGDAGWHKLIFKDGAEAVVHIGVGDNLYMNHYQEIDINKEGKITFVKCESYDKLCNDEAYKAYGANWAEQKEVLETENAKLVAELASTKVALAKAVDQKAVKAVKAE